MPSVYHSSPTNSTFFTTCCNTAIGGEQENCPKCGEEVTPHGRSARWNVAFGPEKRLIREKLRKRGLTGSCLVCGKPAGNPAISGNCHC